MRYLAIFWALPMGVIWGWYFLSYHDLHFGIPILSRDGHELVFAIYGQMLGMEPSVIPPLLARACVVDTLILLAILAFRRRKVIREWLAGGRPNSARLGGAEPEAGRAHPAG